MDPTIQGLPATEPAPIPNGADTEHPPAPKETYEWDRTIEEDKQKQLRAKAPLPPPKAKTLPWPDFCEYWNSLRELPVAPCIRLYVQRWLPVLTPVVEYDRFNNVKESHPSDLKIVPGDGPLSEDLILQLGGVGDYTFRLNDTRRPWEQGTVCQSQLETKRLWDTYPPVFDAKRLDYEDKKNQVYIKFARARGILPREDEQEKEQADMAQAATMETVLEDSRRERARTDQLQQEARERAEREARDAKEALARAQVAAAQPAKDEPKVATATPAGELMSVVTAVAELSKSLQPAKDDSLSKYLEVQAERERSQRERDKEDREEARRNAAAERERADKLQAEMLADFKAKAQAPPAAAITPKTDVELMEEMVKKQALMKQLTGRGGSQAEEEEKPSKIDKWLEAMPIIAPIAQSFIGGIFQTIHFGFQTWQTISYNNALGKTGASPKPPTTMEKPPEPGQPIPAQAPAPSPQQQAQQQTMQIILAGVSKLIGPLQRALQNSKTGSEFAVQLIEFSEEGRADYDRIRNVADTLTRLGMTVPGAPGVEQFKEAAAYLFQHFPQFYQKIATLETFGPFLEDFYNMDKIEQEEEENK